MANIDLCYVRSTCALRSSTFRWARALRGLVGFGFHARARAATTRCWRLGFHRNCSGSLRTLCRTSSIFRYSASEHDRTFLCSADGPIEKGRSAIVPLLLFFVPKCLKCLSRQRTRWPRFIHGNADVVKFFLYDCLGIYIGFSVFITEKVHGVFSHRLQAFEPSRDVHKPFATHLSFFATSSTSVEPVHMSIELGLAAKASSGL
mmetsp:Transcript_5684/g.12643  ORF Transcript_5684/g.12643 Transcript_5684/m.12643 type:complete len:204 (+) Transcript_5684:113-724(+)